MRDEPRENELKHGVDAVVTNTKELMGKISDELVGALWVKYNKEVREGRMSLEKATHYVQQSVRQWDFREEKAIEPVDFGDIIKDFFS